MNDIRFGQLAEQGEHPQKKGGETLKVFFKLIGFALIVLLMVGGLWFARGIWSSKKALPDAYYAVFLTNGQVYFGRLASKSDKEVVLKNVFYLQTTGTEAQSNLNEQRFSLVKLGQELHGPKDMMYINMDHVIFYEEMKDDSQVVASIKNFK